MPALMFDSDDVATLLGSRLHGCRIATYADLITPAIVTAAAGRLVVIDRGHGDPHNLATVADIEDGLLTVAEGAAKIRQWIDERRPFPTAYHDRNLWPEVNLALSGLPVHHWVATLDGTANPNGQWPDAVQLLGETSLGFHADASIVWNDRWHPLPAGPTAAEVVAVKAALAAQLAAPMALQRAIEAL